MTFLSLSSFYLATLVAFILVLSLFRTKRHRRQVSALFLWEGLREDPRSRAVRRRIPLDLLLALQIASLLALVIALAEPALTRRSATLANLAVVLDGSASMATLTEGDVTRYGLAIEEATRFLNANPATRTTVIQLSSQAEILIAHSESRAQILAAVGSSAPTAFADGSIRDIADVLGGLGGYSSFDRIVLFSDRTLSDQRSGIEAVEVGGGSNWSIDAFSVREDPTDVGVLVFVRLANHSDQSRDATLRIEDGLGSTEIVVALPAQGSESFVLPFPGSRSSAFTATLGPTDDFPADNVRYFSLERPIDLRVAWIGDQSRYLLAAMEAVVPVTRVDRSEPADLTVIHRENVQMDVEGNVLIVHGSLAGLVEIGSDVPGGQVIALQPDHPLLSGVDESGLRVASVPSIVTIAAGEVVLASEELPLLVEFEEEERTVTFLASDLVATNLPITVDFPVLMRNVIGRIVRLPAEISHAWAHAGDPFSLGEAAGERIQAIETPGGRRFTLSDDQLQFVPTEPGFYRLISSRGTYPLAVNVSPVESETAGFQGEIVGDLAGGGATTSGRRLWPLWPWFAGVAVLLLIAESIEYSGIRVTARRRR